MSFSDPNDTGIDLGNSTPWGEKIIHGHDSRTEELEQHSKEQQLSELFDDEDSQVSQQQKNKKEEV